MSSVFSADSVFQRETIVKPPSVLKKPDNVPDGVCCSYWGCPWMRSLSWLILASHYTYTQIDTVLLNAVRRKCLMIFFSDGYFPMRISLLCQRDETCQQPRSTGGFFAGFHTQSLNTVMLTKPVKLPLINETVAAIHWVLLDIASAMYYEAAYPTAKEVCAEFYDLVFALTQSICINVTWLTDH